MPGDDLELVVARRGGREPGREAVVVERLERHLPPGGLALVAVAVGAGHQLVTVREHVGGDEDLLTCDALRDEATVVHDRTDVLHGNRLDACVDH